MQGIFKTFVFEIIFKNYAILFYVILWLKLLNMCFIFILITCKRFSVFYKLIYLFII